MVVDIPLPVDDDPMPCGRPIRGKSSKIMLYASFRLKEREFRTVLIKRTSSCKGFSI